MLQSMLGLRRQKLKAFIYVSLILKNSLKCHVKVSSGTSFSQFCSIYSSVRPLPQTRLGEVQLTLNSVNSKHVYWLPRSCVCSRHL